MDPASQPALESPPASTVARAAASASESGCSNASLLAFESLIAEEAISSPDRFLKRIRRWIFWSTFAFWLLALLPLMTMGLTLWVAVREGRPGAASGLSIALQLMLALLLWGRLFRPFQKHYRPLWHLRGMELTRAKAGKFYETLDSLCSRSGSPKFDGVLLDGDLNASVKRGMRPGIRGARRYLCLGVPLLLSVSPGDLEAILCHEIEHRREDSRLVQRLERLLRFIGWLPGQPYIRDKGLLDAPLAWAAPRIAALASQFWKMEELRADASAARHMGKEVVGTALKRLAIQVPALGDWWREFRLKGDTQEELPPDLMGAWRTWISQYPAAEALVSLEAELGAVDNKLGTHPRLWQRLANVGYPPAEMASVPPPVIFTALDGLFEKSDADALLERFHLWFSAEVNGAWEEAKALCRDARAVLRQSPPEPIDGPEAHLKWQWRQLQAEVVFTAGHEIEAKVVHFSEQHPDFLTARIWLLQRQIDRRQRLDPAKVADLLPRLTDPFERNQLAVEVAVAAERQGLVELATTAREIAQQADLESRNPDRLLFRDLSPGDQLSPHRLSAKQVTTLQEGAGTVPGLQKVAVVYREVPHSAEGGCHLMVVRWKLPKAQYHACRRHFGILLQQAGVPPLTCVQWVTGIYPRPADVVFKLPEAILYDHAHAIR